MGRTPRLNIRPSARTGSGFARAPTALRARSRSAPPGARLAFSTMDGSTHWLTRFLFFRLLGLVYVVAFLVVLWQWEPLLGSDGLLPAARLPGGRAPLDGQRRQRLPAPALALLALRLGPCLPHRRLGRLGRGARARRGARERAAPGRALVPLHVVRARRRPLLWLWLGDPAARGRLSGDLPGPALAALAVRRREPALAARDHAAALADLPHDARRGADQAPRGSLLARSHVPGVPLRDPAQPEPALVVPAPAAALVPPARGGVQPPGGARASVVLLRPAPRRVASRAC